MENSHVSKQKLYLPFYCQMYFCYRMANNRLDTWWEHIWFYIAITNGCVWYDSETHESVLLARTTCEAGSCIPVKPVECVCPMISHNKVPFSHTFFKFAICFIVLINLGETCHLKGRNKVTVWRMVPLLCCYDCDNTQQHYDVTQYVVWPHTCMNGLWIFITKRAIHKHNLYPLETMACL